MVSGFDRNGCNVSAKSDSQRKTALFYASFHGNVETFDLLVANGASGE